MTYPAPRARLKNGAALWCVIGAVSIYFAQILIAPGAKAEPRPFGPQVVAVVALQQCDMQSFSMIDDIRLGLFLSKQSQYGNSLAAATQDLREARRILTVDCADEAIRQDMLQFERDILPGIRARE